MPPMEKTKGFLVSSKAELLRKQKEQKKKSKSCGFESLGLSYNVFRGVKRKGYRVPTPIQRKTMPLILSGNDVVAMARTGSGKTAAFLVPMLEKLQQHVPQAGIRALILSPTRDLALQTLKFTKELGRFTDLRVSLLVGGDSMECQFEELAQSPDIVIATPGRLMHHLSEVDDLSLRTVEYVVFDEADCLFSMGFAEQLHTILNRLSENRQTLLFSATLPRALKEFAEAGLRDPQVVRLNLESKMSPDLKLIFLTLRREEKYAAVLYLIREQISSDQQTLLFVATQLQAEFLKVLLREEGIDASISYGKMDHDARNINISKFRARKTMLFIVTDLAARGIDIPLLDNVINFDFPPNPKLFLHRVGRAARAGRAGTAYSFVTAEDMPYLLDLHLFLSKPIKAAPTEEEVLQNMDGVMSEMDEAISKGESVYGRFPQTALDLFSDRVREVIESSTELMELRKPCENAFRRFSTTKGKPSRESVKRAKDLPREGMHPLFKHALGGTELAALAFSQRLKNFRPKQTILEAEGEASKSKHHGSQLIDVMKMKRAVHEDVINKFRQQHSNDHLSMTKLSDRADDSNSTQIKEKPGSGSKRKAVSFKDDEFFISSVPTNQHFEAGLSVRGNEGFVSNRLDAAVMDLIADDPEGMRKQRSSYHWDKRSKKYIKLNSGDRVTSSGKIKTEGGAKVKATKTGIYERWKKESHKKISLKGHDTDSAAAESASSAGGGLGRVEGGRGKFHYGRKRQSIPNAHLRPEIKDREQVRKERERKALLKSKSSASGGNNKKGKKFRKGAGKKGGKGRKV